MERKKRAYIILLFIPSIVLPIIFTHYPMIKGSIMAFQGYNLMDIGNIRWIGFGNFKKLLIPNASNSFYVILGNTVKWVRVSLLFQFLIGSGVALLLKKKFKGFGIYQGLTFFPWAVSGFVIDTIWQWMSNGTSSVINDILSRMGIISEPIGWLVDKNTALLSCVVVNIWYGVPLFTIMITTALRGVSEDLYEAASVDGASAFGKSWNITVPSIQSVLLLTVLMKIIWIFNFPDLIHSVTQDGPADSSHIVTSYIMQLVRSLDYGLASSVGLLFVLFLIIFTIIYLIATKRMNSED